MFKSQRRVFWSQIQNFRKTSVPKLASPCRESIVDIHNPDNDTTTLSTREGSNGFSSRLETRFEGDTSNSDVDVEENGEYIWIEDGCEVGRIRVDEEECTARGTEIGAEGG